MDAGARLVEIVHLTRARAHTQTRLHASPFIISELQRAPIFGGLERAQAEAPPKAPT